MAELKFERAHSLGLAGARQALQRVSDDMVESYATQCEWDGDTLRFKRSGVRGSVTVTEQQVLLVARLGVLLAAFKPRIEEQLDKNFDRYFG